MSTKKRTSKPKKTLAPLPSWRKGKTNSIKPKAGTERKKRASTKRPPGALAAGVGSNGKAKRLKTTVISPEGEANVLSEFTPSTSPIQEIIREKVDFKGGGVLHFRESLEPSEGISLVNFFADTERCSGIAIGLTLTHMQHGPHGSRYDAIECATGLDRKTLANYKSVIGKIGVELLEHASERALEKHRPSPSYSHLARIATLPRDKQEKLVDRIVDDELTVIQVADEVRRIKGKPNKKAKPAPEKGALERLQEALAHSRELQLYICTTAYSGLETVQKLDFRESIRPIAREFSTLELL